MAIEFLDEVEQPSPSIKFIEDAPEATKVKSFGELSTPDKFKVAALGTAQVAGGFLPAGLSVPVTIATERGIQQIKGETPEDAQRIANYVGAIDAAITAATVGLPFASSATPFVKKAIMKKGAKGILPALKEAAEYRAKQEAKRSATKFIAKQSKSTKIPRFAVKRALDLADQGDDLFKITPKSIEAIGDNIDNAITAHGENVKSMFDIRLDELAPKAGPIQAKLSKEASNIIPAGRPREVFKKAILSGADEALVDINEEVIERLFNGGVLSFDEARRLNSAMFQVTDGIVPNIGSGIPGKVNRIKTALSKDIEVAVPGYKEMNRSFAENTGLLKDIRKKMFEKTNQGWVIKKDAVKRIGKEVAGEAPLGETQVVRNLKKLQAFQPEVKFLTDAADSTSLLAIDEAVAKHVPKSSQVLSTGIGGGLGGASYLFTGSPGIGVAVAGTSIASTAIRDYFTNPANLSKYIKAKGTGTALSRLAKQPIQKTAARSIGSNLAEKNKIQSGL